MPVERHPIRLGLMSFMLRLIKVRAENAYVELSDESLAVQFGYVDAEIPYANMEAIEIKPWPVLGGVGLRIWTNRTMGYIGALGDALWITLKEPQDLRAGPGSMSMQRRAVVISTDNAVALKAALESRFA